jgi:hypothetical protein
MRLLLTAAVALLLFAPAETAAQTDEIGLFVDTGFENCKLSDTSPGVLSVYVVHSTSSGATGSQFKLQTGSGVMLSYLGETSPFPLVIGNTQSGISVGYGSCQYSDILVSTISYYAAGTSATCASIWVVPDPASLQGYIEVVSCSSSRYEAAGSLLVINSDGSCDCGPMSRDTNWGRIKDIYD